MARFQLRKTRPATTDLRETVVSLATVKPLSHHAFDLQTAAHPMGRHSVVVFDLTLDNIGLRSPHPLNVCTHYQVECADRTLSQRDSRVRVTSCRRASDGLYDIHTEICR